MKFAFVLFSIFFLFFGNSNFKRGTHAILTGNYVEDISDANFMVMLKAERGNDTVHCGGVIISSLKFVTAAHCLSNIESATVSLGSLDPDTGEVIIDVADYVLHPDWNDTFDHDIAVGFFSIELNFNNNIDEIEVVEDSYTVHENLRVAAYGYGGSYLNPVNKLRWTVVNVMNFQDGSNSYNAYNQHLRVGNSNFFLGPQTHTRSGIQNQTNHIFDGDSGGPIVEYETGKLVGIITAGVLGKPGICTKIAGCREFMANPRTFKGMTSLSLS